MLFLLLLCLLATSSLAIRQSLDGTLRSDHPLTLPSLHFADGSCMSTAAQTKGISAANTDLVCPTVAQAPGTTVECLLFPRDPDGLRTGSINDISFFSLEISTGEPSSPLSFDVSSNTFRFSFVSPALGGVVGVSVVYFGLHVGEAQVITSAPGTLPVLSSCSLRVGDTSSVCFIESAPLATEDQFTLLVQYDYGPGLVVWLETAATFVDEGSNSFSCHIPLNGPIRRVGVAVLWNNSHIASSPSYFTHEKTVWGSIDQVSQLVRDGYGWNVISPVFNAEMGVTVTWDTPFDGEYVVTGTCEGLSASGMTISYASSSEITNTTAVIRCAATRSESQGLRMSTHALFVAHGKIAGDMIPESSLMHARAIFALNELDYNSTMLLYDMLGQEGFSSLDPFDGISGWWQYIAHLSPGDASDGLVLGGSCDSDSLLADGPCLLVVEESLICEMVNSKFCFGARDGLNDLDHLGYMSGAVWANPNMLSMEEAINRGAVRAWAVLDGVSGTMLQGVGIAQAFREGTGEYVVVPTPGVLYSSHYPVVMGACGAPSTTILHFGTRGTPTLQRIDVRCERSSGVAENADRLRIMLLSV